MSAPNRCPTRWLALALALAFLVLPALAEEAGGVPLVSVYQHEGMVHPISAAVLERVLADASEKSASLVIIELDTPGGLVTSAEKMITAILNSPVPVCVYVSPKGAHAASAGFFLLQAADVAAMAPVTRTGSAHPVMAGGENKKDDINLMKVAEDLAALVRAAASARGRPAELAEQAVYEAKAWSAEEAREAGLVELVEPDLDALLLALDGREIIRANGERETLTLTDPRVERVELTTAERLKNTFFHPIAMGLLLVLAVLGFYIEYNNPGLIFPGLLGALCLIVFLYGAQLLPVNVFGVALIALGLVLFVLEVKFVSFGALTLAGGLCVGVGLYVLFDREIPGMQVPIKTIILVVLALMAVVGLVTALVVKALRSKTTTGREGVVGESGQATSAIDPTGTVFVHGEVWSAVAASPIEKGRPVRIVAVEEGLRLRVEELPGALDQGENR